MQLPQVQFESHQFGATIYVAGPFGETAAFRAEEFVRDLAVNVRSLRVDLRAVDLIDPHAYVRVARSLRRWREAGRGRLILQFPAKSLVSRSHSYIVVDQPMIGIAASTAMSWPMSTSPG
jgi:hypothetical protein